MSSTTVVGQRDSKVVFISYCHADVEAATQIKEALIRVGLRPWIDTVEIQPGQSFTERMSDGLSEGSYLLAFDRSTQTYLIG